MFCTLPSVIMIVICISLGLSILSSCMHEQSSIQSSCNFNDDVSICDKSPRFHNSIIVDYFLQSTPHCLLLCN